MKQVFGTCIAAAALAAVAGAQARAQDATGQLGAGLPGNAPSLALPGGVGAGMNSGGAGAAGGAGEAGEAGGIGAHGAFQGGYSMPLSEMMSLQLDGALDIEDQAGSGEESDLRGRIGIGKKF